MGMAYSTGCPFCGALDGCEHEVKKSLSKDAELTKLKSDVAEAEKYLCHLDGCEKIRTAKRILVPCSCGLDEFKSRAFLSKTTNG